METRADEEVLALSVAQPAIFRELVDRYEKPFLKRAYYVMKSREEAEDVVQETFTKIYMNAGKFHKVEGASFKSWGYKILLNTAFTSYKRMHKRDGDIRVEQEILATFPDRKNFVAEEEIRDYIASIISRMPKMLGKSLTLHFLEDKSHKEIARIENISVSAVKTRVHRAKKEFKKIEPNVAL